MKRTTIKTLVSRCRRACGYPHFFLFRSYAQARADIFRLALDIAQTSASQAIFIDNTPMFVQITEGLGIRSIIIPVMNRLALGWPLTDCRRMQGLP
jgi:hypothetical protein